MEAIKIIGGQRLRGEIPISGAKNACLPLMIASLLSDQTLNLTNMPRLADVTMLTRILDNHGVDISVDDAQEGKRDQIGDSINFKAANITDTTAPYELVSRMRAGFWVLGPLLARCGAARVSLPGGCAIGTRPVDLHIAGLKALGVEIELEDGYIIAHAPKGLHGGHIKFPKVSVGATHNVLMAACLAKGETIIENAAREPEVGDLAACLVKMGAHIEGIDSSVLHIQGVDKLHGATHSVLPDRIETGTYAMAAAMTGGEVELTGTNADLLEAVVPIMAEAGVEITPTNRGLRIVRNGARLNPVDIETQPYPGFPTDLQAQLMALMTLADGTSRITETIFENRFMHVQELVRLGADISLDGDHAIIKGVGALKGAPVMATDLRASVSLVIAGLAAEGETIINRVYHLDRGFEAIERKLGACGAHIERLDGQQE